MPQYCVAVNGHAFAGYDELADAFYAANVKQGELRGTGHSVSVQLWQIGAGFTGWSWVFGES